VITFVLVVHTLIAIALVAVILLQRSEGGALGIGGSGGGLMTARGAADLLTRSTTVLAGLFILTSIVLAVLAGVTHRTKPIDTSLARTAPAVPGAPAPSNGPAPAPANGPGGIPLGLPGALPAPAAPTDSVPLAK
jgi:preprotein translocase subunit SecG